jgi:GNAT superfamily N-acetyltransferase
MKFTIRRCKDLELINKLKHQCFHKDDLTDSDLNSTYWFVAWTGGQPAGFCGVQYWGEGRAFFNLAGVLPEFRGHGLQKRMIKARERYCKGWANALYTYTSSDNAASMNSLIRCGFRPFESETQWAGDEFVYWRKRV